MNEHSKETYLDLGASRSVEIHFSRVSITNMVAAGIDPVEYYKNLIEREVRALMNP